MTCTECAQHIEVDEGIPLLVRDPAALRREISLAEAGVNASWYRTPHDAQMVGPYRHHLLKRRHWVEASLRGLGPEERKVALDAGCGDGTALPWLAPLVGELYATDYHPTRAQRAAGRGAVAVAVADLTDLAIADGSLDLVFCNHVLEHIPDDRRVLVELARTLKPGGRIVLGVPNEGAAWWRFAYRLEPRYRRTTDHVQFYTADSVSKVCAEVGLEVEHLEYLGWGLPSWTLDAVVRRWRWVDDLAETVGRRLVPRQASSLYLLLRKR